MQQISKEYNVTKKDIPCFHCEGTGKKWVAIKNVYGKQAGEKAKSKMEGRNHYNKNNNNNDNNNDNNDNNDKPNGNETELKTLVPIVRAPNRDDASFFENEVQEVSVAEELETRAAAYETRAAAYVVVPINNGLRQSSKTSNTSNETLNANIARAHSMTYSNHSIQNSEGKKSQNENQDEQNDPEKEKDEDSLFVPHPSLDRCWVCRGTGKAAGVLPGIMDRAKLNDGGGERKGETKGETKGEIKGETSTVEAWSDTEPGETNLRIESISIEEELCEICWCDPPKYGISTSCSHFFCIECIQGHLKQVKTSGEFPGFCPMCQASAPQGEDPVYGRIDGKAMTFLQRHNVIEKEFQFQFMKKQNEDQKLFFECPAKCGNYLIDVDPTYVLRDHAPAVKTERCPCGQGVCVQCHQLVSEADFFTHRCPESKIDHSIDDAATMAMMKKLGKKCPNCNMFIIKNDGCDIMMCGDKAHGDLRKAIRSGGCGQCFKWSNLQKISDNITNFQGQRLKCNPPVKYASEIAKEKKKFGFIVSENEMKLAELKLDELEVEQGGAAQAALLVVPVDAPINLRRVVLTQAENPNEIRQMMHAIKRRDPYQLLLQAVNVYHMQPKRRLAIERRRHLDNYGRPGEAIWFIVPYSAWALILWSVLKQVFKFILWPLTIIGCCKHFKYTTYNLNRTTMFFYSFVFPIVLSGCILIWKWGEGPLNVLAVFILITSIYLAMFVAYIDLSSTSDSPLTQGKAFLFFLKIFIYDNKNIVQIFLFQDLFLTFFSFCFHCFFHSFFHLFCSMYTWTT